MYSNSGSYSIIPMKPYSETTPIALMFDSPPSADVVGHFWFLELLETCPMPPRIFNNDISNDSSNSWNLVYGARMEAFQQSVADADAEGAGTEDSVTGDEHSRMERAGMEDAGMEDTGMEITSDEGNIGVAVDEEVSGDIGGDIDGDVVDAKKKKMQTIIKYAKKKKKNTTAKNLSVDSEIR